MIFTRAMRRNAIKLTGERSTALDLARGRLVLLSAFFVLAYIMLAARVVDLTVIQGHFDVYGEDQTQQNKQGAATMRRAEIYDRNGVMLATTLKTASLYVDPYLIADPKATARGLVQIFSDLSYGTLLQELQSKKRFIRLRRNVTPAEQRAILQLGEPGLAFEYEDRRVYPQGSLAAHLVGYTNIDTKGLSGVERNFENMLSTGELLKLTIDVRLQHALRRELQKAIADFSAKAGVGVIMDVGTGEVLAGVSLPDFDPHNAGEARTAEIFNRLTLGVYELGSVFKIFSTAAFLETHDVPMSATFDASEPLTVGKYTIKDYHAEDRILTIPEVFMYSSNIGAAMMGQAVGTDRLRGFYEDIGLLSPLEFEIREITAPQVPNPWREVNTLTASYGHGVATTPLQVVAAVSSIVNGGTLVHPKLVLDEEENKKPKPELSVVSPQTAHRMRQLLRLVVTDGTGSKAEVPGYSVGGKTGTAEKPGEHGGYDRTRLLSSFIGVFPIEEPRYAILIAVDEPHGTTESSGYATGGWVAAPAVARVVAAMAAILGIPAESQKQTADIGTSLKQFVSVKAHE